MSARLPENLDLIADAPDGIKKLRGLILELAVRGKLVPQDPKDEPASELLKRIAAEKALLLAEGAIRGKSTISTIKRGDAPFVIPSKWIWVPFREIMISRDGERIPVSKDERNGKAKIYDYYGASGVIDKIDGYLFDKPLLLIGEDGANLINRSTPIAFIARGKYWVNNHAHVLDGISEDFLRFIELHINAIDLKPYVTGTAQPKMNQAKMNSIPIALPPLAEQQRIVAKVDELMALCDRMETEQADAEAAHATLVQTLLGTLTQSRDAAELAANWQRLSQHFDTLFTTEASLDALKKTVLQLAVMGKLVPQDPKDEPASELLKHIQAEEAKLLAVGKIKKDKPLSPVGEDEKPFELPERWEWIRLGGLLPEFQNGVSSRGDSGGELVIVLRLADIKDGAISLADTRELPIDSSVIGKYRLKDGDILITRVNGSADIVGHFVVVDHVSKAIYCDHFIRLRISQNLINPRFLALVGASQLVRDKIGNLFITTAGQKTVNQGHISSLAIPLLSVAEQHRIVAKVDELMALCDGLKADLAKSRARQARLATTLIESALQAA